ncbi:MAG: hypothetical protein FWD57_11070, partial [Polyangiaceae bacterium]|nr:hypothetical protein [Polyangiaceae bacterium]
VCLLVPTYAFAVACGTPEIVVPPPDGGGGDTSPDGADVQLDLDIPPDVDGEGHIPIPDEPFWIDPPETIINPVTAGQTVQFLARSVDTDEPINVTFWHLDKTAGGTIDANGLFTANGAAGGVVIVGAETKQYSATAVLKLGVSLVDNDAGVNEDTIARLEGGAAGAGPTNSPDSTFRWLYPYDRTVFPRSLLSPRLQFAGNGADYFYLHAKSEWFELKGFYSGSNPERLLIPQKQWDALTWSTEGADTVDVQITKINGPNVTGPIKQQWFVAPASLKGVLYYNTYDDPRAINGTFTEEERGAVMAVRPGGQREPELLLGGDGSCKTCHSVSANGTRMTLSAGHTCNQSYVLSPGPDAGTVATEAYSDDCGNEARHDDTLSFGGLTPDGELVLTSASMAREVPWDFFPNIASVDDDEGPRDSVLMLTDTGEKVAAPGFDGVVHKALMPSFSPYTSHDHKGMVAFVHFEVGGGHTLSVMDFDQPTRTFSNLRVVYNAGTSLYVGWPSFTPDGASIVYQVGSRRDYSTWRDGTGRLFIVDVAVGQTSARAMAILNGRRSSTSYLEPVDQDILSFEPTVLPMAVGGYFWTVFTSRRSYGNLITGYGEGPDDPTVADPSPKKLWVAAFDIGSAPTADPSHPAFYLEGQDLVSGNMRGFWSMEPCRQIDDSCESGSDCCDGFCRAVANDDGGVSLQCVPRPEDECSMEYERCDTKDDCCDEVPELLCISGLCAKQTIIH